MKISGFSLPSSLAKRLTISIILFSSAITLILTCVQLYGTYRKELGDIDGELARIERAHLKALSQSLWAANLKELGLQLEGLVQTPYIEYAAIREGGKLWHEVGARNSTNHIVRDFPLHYRYRGVHKTIGMLTVVADLDMVYNHLMDEALGVVLRNGVKTFLVAAFMLWFFHRHVNRDLTSIAGHLGALDLNIKPEPLVLPRKPARHADEFDMLSKVINTMQERIYQDQQAIRQNELRFHAIADYTVDWESWFAPHGELIWVNPSVARVTGYTPEECYAMAEFPLPIVWGSKDRRKLREGLSNACHCGTTENLEFGIQHKDGRRMTMAISWQPIYGSDREFSGARASVRDISYLKQVESDLKHKIEELVRAKAHQAELLNLARHEKARMSSLLGAMSLGILFEDADNRVKYVNPAFRRIWLIPKAVELTNQSTAEVLSHATNILSRPDHFSRQVLRILDTHEVSDSFEISMSDGRVVTQLSYPVHDQEGVFVGRLWVYEDITNERQTAEQLIYLAERDSLTGLCNRHRFQGELSRMLADANRRKTHGALLFLDLDEFKHINDNFGHRAGDTVLIRMAGEINALVRKNEIFARIGGDEFAVLMPDTERQAAIHLAERITRVTAQIPFSFGRQNLRLTSSLGIALYPEHGDNEEDLVAHADAAMYLAKDAGKNTWRIYDSHQDLSKEMLDRLSWNERIGHALENSQLELHFQGVYRVTDRQLCHLEALLRMRDEAAPGGVILPGYFIPLSEKTGKILDIDRWVIARTVELLAQAPNLPAIAINISGRSFDDPQLPHYIRDQLTQSRVAPSRLMVELTETSAVSDIQDAQRFIDSLRDTGCPVCLDDFGSGFSSFSYLKQLKADVLKIDGLFIRDLPRDRDNQIFVKSIVEVARGLKKRTVAEFVEDAHTLALLAELGVDLAQGYHLDMPQVDHPALHADLAQPTVT